jgi:hypothetical protein
MTKAKKDKEICDGNAMYFCAFICGTWTLGWPVFDVFKDLEANIKPSRGCVGRAWVKHYGTAAACFACTYYPQACINDYNCNVKYCTTGKTTIGCGLLLTPSF